MRLARTEAARGSTSARADPTGGPPPSAASRSTSPMARSSHCQARSGRANLGKGGKELPMGIRFVPGAERLTPRGSSNTMDGKGGPRATCHATVSKPGSFEAMHDVLVGKKSESHVLYDMKGDRLRSEE